MAGIGFGGAAFVIVGAVVYRRRRRQGIARHHQLRDEAPQPDEVQEQEQADDCERVALTASV